MGKDEKGFSLKCTAPGIQTPIRNGCAAQQFRRSFQTVTSPRVPHARCARITQDTTFFEAGRARNSLALSVLNDKRCLRGLLCGFD